MATTTAFNKQKRLDALNAVCNTTAGRLKLALIKAGASGTYDESYNAYVVGMGGDECPATGGYTQGGVAITVTNALVGSVAQASHSAVTWASATISADGEVIYDSGDSNKVLYVANYGATKTSTNGDFVVTSPAGGFVSI